MDTYTRRLGGTSVGSAREKCTFGGKKTFGIEAFARGMLDRFLAALALIFFAPAMILVALLILVMEGRPIFFCHNRIGQGGRRFGCLKFRSMPVDADRRLAELLASDPEARAEWEASQKLENDPRVTCLGAFLRKSSLDELPQFWNVLRGDMALVGPRPIVESEAHHYGECFADYLSVKPGITGHWQVSGRSATTYRERVALDMDYIRHRPFRRDIAILLKTVKVVVAGSGAK